jgi:hypothetical protein
MKITSTFYLGNHAYLHLITFSFILLLLLVLVVAAAVVSISISSNHETIRKVRNINGEKNMLLLANINFKWNEMDQKHEKATKLPFHRTRK